MFLQAVSKAKEEREVLKDQLAQVNQPLAGSSSHARLLQLSQVDRGRHTTT